MNDSQYLTFCDGHNLKNKEVFITLTPDIAFKLELLAKRNEITLEQYIDSVLQKHVDLYFQNNKNYFKNFFK